MTDARGSWQRARNDTKKKERKKKKEEMSKDREREREREKLEGEDRRDIVLSVVHRME